MNRIETEKREMTPYLATGIIEGFEEAIGEDEEIAAWQFLIDTGMCWRLQGRFGRGAVDLIRCGVCSLPRDLGTLCGRAAHELEDLIVSRN